MARSTVYTTEKIGPKQSLTPEGFLLCQDVALARTGMMIYGPDETPIKAGADGVTRIFREDSDVFRFETIASAMGKPVTNDHPDDDVTPDSWKDLAHGIMLNVRRGEGAYDDLLLGDLLITTPEGIKAVQAGKREVSLGYEASYDETGPGVGKQTDIIINHIALVEQGRCGPRCAISDHKSTTVIKDETMKNKPSKILDALMRAFKAKDAAEVEKLAEEVKDEGTMSTSEEGETHIHIHNGGAAETPTVDEGAAETPTVDEDFQAHVDKNESEHAELRSRLDALEELVSNLGGTKDAKEDEEDTPEEALDELPEEFRENAKKAKDSAYFADSFRDAAAMAEILVPGIRIPTFDRAQRPGTSFKKICGLRRQALDLAYAQPATRGLLDDVMAGKTLDTKNMTCDAVRTLFNSAAGLQRTANNSSGQARSTNDQQSKKAGPLTIAELNKRNAARYANS
jgi:hypothetical protein